MWTFHNSGRSKYICAVILYPKWLKFSIHAYFFKIQLVKQNTTAAQHAYCGVNSFLFAFDSYRRRNVDKHDEANTALVGICNGDVCNSHDHGH